MLIVAEPASLSLSSIPPAPCQQTSPFQGELEQYVRQLGLPKPEAVRALGLLAVHDFSAARAHLVASGERAGGGGPAARLLPRSVGGHVWQRRRTPPSYQCND